MNNKCPYCHKEIEIIIHNPEEYYQPCPTEDIRLLKFTKQTVVYDEKNLSDYLKNLNIASNKIAFLVYAFKRLHDYYINDEQDESKDAFSFMGKIWKNANKDYGYLMKVIWDTSSVSIAGSHLNYINKTVIERRKKEMQSAVAHAVQPKKDITKQPGYK